MPYDEKLAQKVRRQFKRTKGITEKKMFGGICFMVNGNMACGVERNNLVIRVGPDNYEEALKKPHARPMDFTGRPLRGFVYVSPEGYKTPINLKKWIEFGINFVQSLPAKSK